MKPSEIRNLFFERITFRQYSGSEDVQSPRSRYQARPASHSFSEFRSDVSRFRAASERGRLRGMEMKPGRELDVLVAENVFGCKVQNRKTSAPNCGCDPIDKYGNQPHASTRMSDDRHLKFYSQEIEAAWEVVEKMTSLSDKDVGFALTKNPGTIGASFSNLNGSFHFQSNGESAPHAICLAALKAVA